MITAPVQMSYEVHRTPCFNIVVGLTVTARLTFSDWRRWPVKLREWVYVASVERVREIGEDRPGSVNYGMFMQVEMHLQMWDFVELLDRIDLYNRGFGHILTSEDWEQIGHS